MFLGHWISGSGEAVKEMFASGIPAWALGTIIGFQSRTGGSVEAPCDYRSPLQCLCHRMSLTKPSKRNTASSVASHNSREPFPMMPFPKGLSPILHATPSTSTASLYSTDLKNQYWYQCHSTYLQFQDHGSKGGGFPSSRPIWST